MANFLKGTISLLFCVFSLVLSQFKERPLELCTYKRLTPAGLKADCSNVGLNVVPEGIPPETTHLILDNNNISTLRNESFSGLENLVRLSIAGNGMVNIQVEALMGLKQLVELDLYNNSLESKDALPSAVFEPVSQSLKLLDIRLNLMGEDLTLVNYQLAVTELDTLNEIKMDLIPDTPLPEQYGNLIALKTMIFSGGRQNTHIFGETFRSVRNLNISKIDLSGVGISYVSTDTFSILRSLDVLDVSDNPFLRLSIMGFASSLKNTSITKLRMNNTGIGHSGRQAADILRVFCHLPLKELTLDHNFINVIEEVFKECFQTLELLSVGDNYLTINTEFVFDTLLGLHSLRGYNLSSQRRITVNSPVNQSICQQGMTCPISLPKHIEWLDVSNSGFIFPVVPQVVFLNNNSLSYFKVSSNGVQNVRRPLYCAYGVVPTLEHIDGRNNALECIAADVFDTAVTKCDWGSLKKFYLGSNQIGNIQGNTCNKNKSNILGFLKPLRNLEVLDLSNNKFDTDKSLSDVEVLHNLDTLDISSNRLHDLNLDLGKITRLSNLNISNNNIRCLSQAMTLQLNRLQQKRNDRIKIDMSGNWLSCNCKCLYFLQWLTKTDVHVVDYRSYICEFDDGRVEPLGHIDFIVAKLNAKCYGTAWLKNMISIEVTVILLITFFSTLYRNRHDIWYIYLKIKLDRQRLNALLNRKQYEYTAFLSCEYRDAVYFARRKFLPELETQNTGFKFCIAQRDFVVGATIVDNITRAMNKSRRIVFIVSQYFLKSKWCREEIRIAHQISLERGESIIICIFMPNVKQEELPGTIRLITKTVTCLKWSPDPNAEKVFWLMLQKGLVEEADKEDDFLLPP